MKKFTLYHNTFYWRDGTNQNSFVAGRLPKYFEFTTEETGVNFYDYMNVGKTRPNEKNILVLLESRGIVPQYFAWIESNWHLYDTIFTHSSQVIEKCPNAKWIPGGGVWIGGQYGGGDIGLHEKTKLVSMVSSDKVMCELHAARLSLARHLHSKSLADVYGTFNNPNSFVTPASYLKDYMFCIQVENFIDKLYFTEKLLNCFATGTIPIYIGATDVGKYFDENGIIKVNSIYEIPHLLNTLTPEVYKSKLESVKTNLNICKHFICPEDFMWENYLREEYE